MKKSSQSFLYQILCFLGWTVLLSLSSPAQSQNLSVNITAISAAGDSTLRGKTAAFPYPILSFIRVFDNGHVTGLASQTDWIGPDDLADIGVPVKDIWNPILERYGSAADTNLYNQRPAPQFIEICETCEPIVPVTTMLAMDVSGSIDNIPGALDSAKAGVRRFISEMRPTDRAGVMQFYCRITSTPITNDKTLLNNFIDATQTGPWTPLYESLLRAIEQLKNENEPRSIIVYTDGEDTSNNPGHGQGTGCDVLLRNLTSDAVITAARESNISIHTIALGAAADTLTLKRIAATTGGEYFSTPDGANFSTIYERLASGIKNFYVMAHSSLEPCAIEPLREVAITANVAGQTAANTRGYSVAIPPKEYDLTVSVNADKNNIRAGDELHYTITLENLGPDPAFNLTVHDSVSEFLTPVDFSPPMDSDRSTSDFLVWRLDSLAAGNAATISFRARVSATLPDTLAEIFNTARVFGPCDNNLNNDQVETSVEVERQVLQCDLSLTKRANPETVRPGEEITYSLTLSNNGPDPAQGIVLTDTLPAFVTAIDWPGDISGNVLSLTIPTLAQDTTILFTARVADALPNSMTELINRSCAAAACDANPANNCAQAVVNVLHPEAECDLSLTKRANPETVRPGEEITYSLTLSNNGPDPAQGIVLTDTLPAFVTAIDWPGDISGNVLSLTIPTLAQDTTILFTARVADALPNSMTELINRSCAAADCDANPANNCAQEIVSVSHPQIEYDLSLTKTASVETVQPGEQFSYSLALSNLGPDVAEGMVLTDTLPNFITAINWPGQTAGNILSLTIPGLAQDTTIAFIATVAASLPDTAAILINRSGITAPFDTNPANNFARAVVRLPAPDCLVLDYNVFQPQNCPLTIEFGLRQSGHVRVDLHDITGYRVANLLDRNFSAGRHPVSWDGRAAGQEIGSGVYIIVFRSDAPPFFCKEKVIVVR